MCLISLIAKRTNDSLSCTRPAVPDLIRPPPLRRPLLPTVLIYHTSQLLGDAPQPKAAVESSEDHAPLPLKGLSVLEVDDNGINRTVITAFLEIGGAEAQIANSGAEAIEMALNEHFDLIPMDIQMLDMEGVKLNAVSAPPINMFQLSH